jgi:hypothetical protein
VRAAESTPAPIGEEPVRSIEFSRDVSPGSEATRPRIDPTDGGFGIEKESNASTRIVKDEEDGAAGHSSAPIVRPRFEERTLTLGTQAGRAATPPREAPQEVTIPVRIPAGGSRQIVLRITIQSDDEADAA